MQGFDRFDFRAGDQADRFALVVDLCLQLQDVVEAVHLAAVDRDPSCAPLLADVLLKRFVTPHVESYRELESQASYAIEADYSEIR